MGSSLTSQSPMYFVFTGERLEFPLPRRAGPGGVDLYGSETPTKFGIDPLKLREPRASYICVQGHVQPTPSQMEGNSGADPIMSATHTLLCLQRYQLCLGVDAMNARKVWFQVKSVATVSPAHPGHTADVVLRSVGYVVGMKSSHTEVNQSAEG
eukprot:gb/GECG01015980.1/.p1 GENE.gb/GECG01015980.1/~~gb/GECG01015980.1/.p1  ORF type:complete len:154 (+),score=4.19 gb/GECG01015980.1/:1-462(+)